MSEDNKIIQFVKDTLGTRKKYHDIISNHTFTNFEKDVLLQASVNVKSSNMDQSLINAAYDILISKSILKTSPPKNTNKNSSLLRYLLIIGLLFTLFYLITLKEPDMEEKGETSNQEKVAPTQTIVAKEKVAPTQTTVVKFGNITGQGFLMATDGSAITCGGNLVYIEKSNPNGFIIQSEILREKNKSLKDAEKRLRDEKGELNIQENWVRMYNNNPSNIRLKNSIGATFRKIPKIKKYILSLERAVMSRKIEVRKQQAVVDNAIKDNIHETQCDAQGNYEFDKVEVGTYYISTVVEWYAGEEKQGRVVSKTITVKEGKNRIMITE